MDTPAALHQTFLERDDVIACPETLVGNPQADGYDALIDFLFDVGLGSRSVGVELGGVLAYSASKFKARLPEARLVDCTGAITWIRMVKSDLEISFMKEAAAIADAGVMRAAEAIRPGVHEADAIAEIVGRLARGASTSPELGSQLPTCAPRRAQEQVTSRGVTIHFAKVRR